MAESTTIERKGASVKRYTSFEEFQKDVYPASTESEYNNADQDEKFGAVLAHTSLQRHGGNLRFGTA